jgi:hypothetical protein
MATSTSADSRRRLAEALARHESSQGSGGTTAKKAAIVATVVTLLAGLVLWLLGFFGGGTPREIRELRSAVDAQLQELEKVARNEAPLSYEFASFGPVFDKMRGLPPGMRDQARDEMERLFRARERAEMRSYFALPAAARAAELDRRIKSQEEQRKARTAEWEKRNAERAAQRTGGGRPGSPPEVQGRTAGRDGGQPGGQGGPPAGGGGPGGQGGRGGGPPSGRGTEDGRNTRSKQRIDSTSPAERSQQAEYRRAMDVRRQEMGLPSGGRRP